MNNDMATESASGANNLPRAESRQAIIYVGPSHGLSDCIIRNLEYEFPEFVLIRFADFDRMRVWCDESEDEVRLVIIDDSFCPQLKQSMEEFQERFPTQVICISFNRSDPPTWCANELAAGGRVGSFLPMNLRLDIWLSAVRLMVNGGNYCPPEMMKDMLTHSDTPAGEKQPARGRGKANPGAAALGLTARETQVLTLVAQGFQNKNIAEELGLSEHTVKLHMHHIISKLGASNRTEAAGIFLDSVVQGSSNRAKPN
jgi:DNA-binding NarL/FixJ family response regulator